MKGFDTFDTTNELYGKYYKREEDPVTNTLKFTKPDDEEKFYKKTLEMRENYFDRYAHLKKDPKNHPQDSPKGIEVPKDTQLQRQPAQTGEMPEKDSPDDNVTQTFRRNFESN